MANIPNHFNGQISLSPMSLPINLGCHNTHNFDLGQIFAWISKNRGNVQNHTSCPSCRTMIEASKIAFNSSLAKEIQAYSLSNSDDFDSETLDVLAISKLIPEEEIIKVTSGLKSLVALKIELQKHHLEQALPAQDTDQVPQTIDQVAERINKQSIQCLRLLDRVQVRDKLIRSIVGVAMSHIGNFISYRTYEIFECGPENHNSACYLANYSSVISYTLLGLSTLAMLTINPKSDR